MKTTINIFIIILMLFTTLTVYSRSDSLICGKEYKIKANNGWEGKGTLLKQDSLTITFKFKYKEITINKNIIKEIVEFNKDFKEENLNSDLLPFVKSNYQPPIVDPKFCFGISYTYANVDLKPVESFFREVESHFINQGYNVPRNSLNFTAHNMYMFNFYLRLYKTFGTEIEVGYSPNDVDVWYAGAYLDYYLKFNKIRWLRPHLAIGWGSYSFNTEFSYGNVTVDPSGGMLDKIFSNGGSNGFMIKASVDLGIEGDQTIPAALNLCLSRSFMPNISNSYYGFVTKLNFSSFRFSAGIRIFL